MKVNTMKKVAVSSPFCQATSVILLALICMSIIPNVQAQQQGITSITDVQYPTQVVLQNGVAQVTVTFTVYYNYYMGARLVFGIYDAHTSNVLQGSATATPVPCQSLVSTQNANAALCEAVPASTSGREYANFALTFNSPQQYALRAITGILDQSGNVAGGSTGSSDFTISVIGQPGTDYCSTDKSYYNVGDTITISGHTGSSNPYYIYDYKPNGSVTVRHLGNGPGNFSIQGNVVEPEGTRRLELWMAGIEISGGAKTTMAPHYDVSCNTFTVGPAIQTTTIQTSQSSTHTSSTLMSIIEQNQLLILGAAVLLAAVIIAVALRGRRKPTPTQPTRTSTTPGMIYCEQCRTENPTTNDFCLNCGTKLH